MVTRETWAQRVAEWKASGQSSARYCEGKPFTPGGLRHWAHRLRRGETLKPSMTSVRIVRVERRQAGRAAGDRAQAASGAARDVSAASAEALFVECGGVRLVIRPGFDRTTLTAVIDVLAARGGIR